MGVVVGGIVGYAHDRALKTSEQKRGREIRGIRDWGTHGEREDLKNPNFRKQNEEEFSSLGKGETYQWVFYRCCSQRAFHMGLYDNQLANTDQRKVVHKGTTRSILLYILAQQWRG